MQHPKFVIQSSDGEFRFHLTASNGEIILVSQRYATVAGAERGVGSVKVHAPAAERYERRRSRRDEPYFVLKAAMENGIASVQRSAPVAGIETWGAGQRG
jgi:uncharacterized protein YegP (UPF0339 family)